MSNFSPKHIIPLRVVLHEDGVFDVLDPCIIDGVEYEPALLNEKQLQEIFGDKFSIPYDKVFEAIWVGTIEYHLFVALQFYTDCVVTRAGDELRLVVGCKDTECLGFETFRYILDEYSSLEINKKQLKCIFWKEIEEKGYFKMFGVLKPHEDLNRVEKMGHNAKYAAVRLQIDDMLTDLYQELEVLYKEIIKKRNQLEKGIGGLDSDVLEELRAQIENDNS